MADIAPTIKTIKKNVTLVTWEGLDSDTFLPYKLAGNVITDITVQTVEGGATIQGTLDPDGGNYSDLSDYNGDALAMTDGQISEVAERPTLIVPDSLIAAVPASSMKVILAIWR